RWRRRLLPALRKSSLWQPTLHCLGSDHRGVDSTGPASPARVPASVESVGSANSLHAAVAAGAARAAIESVSLVALQSATSAERVCAGRGESIQSARSDNGSIRTASASGAALPATRTAGSVRTIDAVRASAAVRTIALHKPLAESLAK